jgi:uncharacterized membrane protein YidH (DUF202 family)
MFISSNSDGGGKMNSGVIKEFFNHYYPVSQTPRPMEGYKERAPGYAGTYYPLRASFMTNQKMFAGLAQFKATVNDNGTINVPDGSNMPGTFIEVEPGLFQQVNGTDKAAFRAGNNGRAEYMFNLPFQAFKRAEWYETLTFHLALLSLCLLVFLSAIVAWPVKFLIGRRKAMPANSRQWIAKWVSAAASLLGIAIVLGIAGMFLLDKSISERVPPELYAILALALVMVVVTAVAIIFTLLAWEDKYWGLRERAYYTVVTIAMLVFVWFLSYWNLIGFNF